MAEAPRGTPFGTNDGQYDYEVVGESYYQDTIRAVLAAHPARTFTAWLIPEPQNPHDPNAVMVAHPELGQVGHIPASEAESIAEGLQAWMTGHNTCATCSALIKGGRGGAEAYGVWLDLDFDRLEGALAAPTGQPLTGPARADAIQQLEAEGTVPQRYRKRQSGMSATGPAIGAQPRDYRAPQPGYMQQQPASGGSRPQVEQMVREYKSPGHVRQDADRLRNDGWRIVNQMEHRPRQGCLRIVLLGFFFAFIFPPKPRIVVTYER